MVQLHKRHAHCIPRRLRCPLVEKVPALGVADASCRNYLQGGKQHLRRIFHKPSYVTEWIQVPGSGPGPCFASCHTRLILIERDFRKVHHQKNKRPWYIHIGTRRRFEASGWESARADARSAADTSQSRFQEVERVLHQAALPIQGRTWLRSLHSAAMRSCRRVTMRSAAQLRLAVASLVQGLIAVLASMCLLGTVAAQPAGGGDTPSGSVHLAQAASTSPVSGAAARALAAVAMQQAQPIIPFGVARPARLIDQSSGWCGAAVEASARMNLELALPPLCPVGSGALGSPASGRNAREEAAAPGAMPCPPESFDTPPDCPMPGGDAAVLRGGQWMYFTGLPSASTTVPATARSVARPK